MGWKRWTNSIIRIRIRYCITCTPKILFILIVMILILILLILKSNDIHKEIIFSNISPSSMRYITHENNNTESINISEIRRRINKYNSEEVVLNSDIYGALQHDTIKLVVLVRRYSINLKYMLASLSQLQGINSVLLIFSHTHYDENINELIGNIDFCRVLQIYNPYSIQINPDDFPGQHRRDCSYDMDINTAESLNCTGAFNSDIHGRYRNPSEAETKTHWWWTANKVFQGLQCTAQHYGLTLFLDDNFYFLSDFVYMIVYMKNIAKGLPQCEFLSLATVPKTHLQFNKSYHVEVTTWDSIDHSDVLAFDLSVWKIIVLHYDHFCSVDDSSWSRSLLYVSLNLKTGERFRVLSSVVPRALRTTFCIFPTYSECDLLESVYQTLSLEGLNKNHLFPSHVEIYVNIELDPDESMIFDYLDGGGWNDPRDKSLCRKITHKSHSEKNNLSEVDNLFFL